MLLGMTTNEHQNRALWATALRDLANAVSEHIVPPPTSMQLWTQFAPIERLLEIADGSTPKPLTIKSIDGFFSVTVPVGEPLELKIDWITQARKSDDNGELIRQHTLVSNHESYCVHPIPYEPTEQASE
jgi:hypothetical protein